MSVSSFIQYKLSMCSLVKKKKKKKKKKNLKRDFVLPQFAHNTTLVYILITVMLISKKNVIVNASIVHYSLTES